jgi:hypothetical protein
MRTWFSHIAVVIGLLLGLTAPGAGWAHDGFDSPMPDRVVVSKEPR